MEKDNGKNNKIPFDEDNYTHNIHKENERLLDRRGFMKTMVGAAGVFAISTLPWGGLAAKELMGFHTKSYAKKKIVDIASLSIGESAEFSYPSEHESALLIRLGENEYKAYQNACTHLKCPVFWNREEEKMVCPCHHGYFDAKTGKPTAGPPRRPLPEIAVVVENGAVIATGVKRYET
ncbi:nitrite reductase/ring-hydroxylating ferredoxin subunit [Paenibacillus endophyticus]|uniref:Nitrite reductase/ring-hydroxylating ferredoxin subunit n=1 Tax=Paenibacillus endophyticus TaxID=1294268 RepID=A0A7W5GC11_9BACL|nr:Rieske (2Fe-2S) protein [Paenibacillus endophyticus]MBB3153522.1 nitrite reductase/ring-hydroxylating ferredoxin subunit [Paenibacillus endophyticus]